MDRIPVRRCAACFPTLSKRTVAFSGSPQRLPTLVRSRLVPATVLPVLQLPLFGYSWDATLYSMDYAATVHNARVFEHLRAPFTVVQRLPHTAARVYTYLRFWDYGGYSHCRPTGSATAYGSRHRATNTFACTYAGSLPYLPDDARSRRVLVFAAAVDCRPWL